MKRRIEVGFLKVLLILGLLSLLFVYDVKRYRGQERKFFIGGVILGAIYVTLALNEELDLNFVDLIQQVLKPIVDPLESWLIKYQL